MVGELKATRIRELALRERIPLVWLIDSAGARIQEASGSMFARTGDLFCEQVHMSGMVRQVAAMMGPGAAGTAYIPGLADFVPMVKGTSIVGWPTAGISVMGPEGVVNIIFRKQIEAAGDKDAQHAMRNQMVAVAREQISADIAAGWSFVDDLIDPADTRSTIVKGLELGETKRIERPWRKHGVLPV